MKICVQCGNRFEPYRGFEHQKFCRPKCKNKYWNDRAKRSTSRLSPEQLAILRQIELQFLAKQGVV